MKTKEELIEVMARAIARQYAMEEFSLKDEEPEEYVEEYWRVGFSSLGEAALEALCRALPEPKSRDVMYDARRKSYSHTLAGNFYNQLKEMGNE